LEKEGSCYFVYYRQRTVRFVVKDGVK